MNIGLLLLRLTVGLTLAAHGFQKLFGWFGRPGVHGTGQFFQMLGYRPDRIDTLLAGLTETVGGLLLARGFMTPPVAAAVIGVMLVEVLTLDAFLHYNHSGTVW